MNEYKYDLNWCEGCAVQSQTESCFTCGWKEECKHYCEVEEPMKNKFVNDSINYWMMSLENEMIKHAEDRVKECTKNIKESIRIYLGIRED